jgi:tRNA A-37 threonylcarbamoyl transferase component Bud32/Flp pilus assembly protein TadD
MIGKTIKDFKRLGKGGWGEVWAAEQPIVKTRVAIKLLRSEVSGDQAHVKRFFNEARAVGGIPHAGITKIFDVGFEDDQAFLIMELLDGESLTARIRRVTRLPLDEVSDIGCQIASVLAATHAAGVVHRDLKPDNVFLVPDAEIGERVKVLDFGIAKLSSVNVTGTGSLGTPAYMAPEQWNSPATADHRADLYSLGCVLFEMCCGRPPFIATTPGEACTKHLIEQPPHARELAPALPAELDALIDGLLAKSADRRPAIADIDRVLRAASSGRPRGFARASHPPYRGEVLETAETLSITPANQATVTSLVGPMSNVATLPGVTPARGPAKAVSNATPVGTAVIAQPAKSRTLVFGGVAVAGIAGVIAFVAVRSSGEVAPAELPGAPKLGLATIADYRDPTPATLVNHRSEQIWLAAQDDFARACKLPDAPAQWCAGAEFAAGQVLLMRDDVPGSIAAFERATKLDGEWSVGFLGLADANSHARNREQALIAARRAQALDPRAWQPAMASARALIAANEVDDALIEYRRAMSLAPPNNPVILAEIALAFHYAGKDEEAAKLTKQALALDNTLVNVHILQAELALEARDGKTALVEADAALAVSPKNGAALIARGDALVLLDRRADALQAYKRAVQLRGGMNLLAMSKVRLAAVEAAVANGELPDPRVASPATSERAVGGGRPMDATETRSVPSGNTSPTIARTPPDTQQPTATSGRSRPGPRPGPTLSTSGRTPPANKPNLDRTPPVTTPIELHPPPPDRTPPDTSRTPPNPPPPPPRSVPDGNPGAPSRTPPTSDPKPAPKSEADRTPPSTEPPAPDDRSPPMKNPRTPPTKNKTPRSPPAPTTEQR